MVKYLGVLFLLVFWVTGSLKIGYSQEITKIQKTGSKIGQFSLRNDGENLMRPIGSPVTLVPKAKEEGKEVKKVEKKEIPEEELRPKIPSVIPEAKEVKEEEKEEVRMGLKFGEGEEELPKIISKSKVLPKPKLEQKMPEISPYFSQLAPGEKLLPPEIKEVKKPKVTPITHRIPPKEKVVIAKAQEVIPKAEEVKEIIPPPEPTAPTEELARKEPEFAFQKINPVLKWGIILSGLFTLILILLVRYLWRQRELASLAEIGKIPPERSTQYKSLINDVKELQTGYKELEKMVENVEKRLTPLNSLKGVPIDEFTRNTSKEVIKPIESGIKEIQATCQELEKMFGEFDKRLSPLDALKGLSIKELVQQTSMEFYRPLENEFKKMKISNEQMMAEFEEKMDKKIDAFYKKTKGLEKTVSEIDSRLIAIDSIISSLPSTEGVVSKPVIKTEEVKPTTFKDKRSREVLHNQIYKFSDEGLSIDEIAQRTKLGKGEVRLILGLRKK